MKKPITDKMMLSAAERRLKEHLQTRPATVVEATEIAAQYRSEADRLDAAIKAARDAAGRGSPAIRGRNAGEIRAIGNREAARVRNDIVRDLTPQALQARMRAESWERVAAGPVAVWHAAKTEFESRIQFYADLIGAKK